MTRRKEKKLPEQHLRDQPAFPSNRDCILPGMTLRQWYAGLALQGLCTLTFPYRLTPEAAAKEAVKYADALILELQTISGTFDPDRPDFDPEPTGDWKAEEEGKWLGE